MLSHLPGDEAGIEPSSGSSAAAEPSRTTFEGACTENAARAAARADICWKGRKRSGDGNGKGATDIELVDGEKI